MPTLSFPILQCPNFIVPTWRRRRMDKRAWESIPVHVMLGWGAFFRICISQICISQICISRDLYLSDKCLSGSVFLRFIFFSWTTYTSCPEKTVSSVSHSFSMNFSARVERNTTPTSFRVSCFLAIFFSVWFASYVNIMWTVFGSIPHLLGYTLALRCQIHLTECWTFHKS